MYFFVLRGCLPRTVLLKQIHYSNVLLSRSIYLQRWLCPQTKIAIGCTQMRPFSNHEHENSGGLSSIIEPVGVFLHSDPEDIGAEITGIMKKDWSKRKLTTILTNFYKKPEVKRLAADYGLDTTLFNEAFNSFSVHINKSETLPVDLHILLCDLMGDHGIVEDLFPLFYDHAKKAFPHLQCMDELRKLSDLTSPANWFPEARNLKRKIIFHAGPTNSGKTYHALKRFTQANSGVYCGPLRLLASEVFHKTNSLGTICDLVTGEERHKMRVDRQPADHVSCTVEMTNPNVHYEVAIIDEIQMLRDESRGWAWTRAFLGVCADEVHVCGEPAAEDLVRELAVDTGDEVEVIHYKRLTKLTVQKDAVDTFDNITDGDAVVCFNKKDVYTVSRELNKRDKEAAIIYGSLPAGTKLAQAEKFNNPMDPTTILVATDAIGMGLNLSIQRIILYSLHKFQTNAKGITEKVTIPPHQAKQIAGRAGRYGTPFEEGKVTTFHSKNHALLTELIEQQITPIQKAGLCPTADQLEQFQFLLPKATFSNLIEVFTKLSVVDSDKYFLCEMETFKALAAMIEDIPLSIQTRYVFCCAPIKLTEAFICVMFKRLVGRFSTGDPVTLDFLCQIVDWPPKEPNVIMELTQLENMYDVTDLYLWLSFRFPDMFPECDGVLLMQNKLNTLIRDGVSKVTKMDTHTRTAHPTYTVASDGTIVKLRRPNTERMTHEPRIKPTQGDLRRSQRERTILGDRKIQRERKVPAMRGSGFMNHQTKIRNALRKTEKETPYFSSILDQPQKTEQETPSFSSTLDQPNYLFHTLLRQEYRETLTGNKAMIKNKAVKKPIEIDCADTQDETEANTQDQQQVHNMTAINYTQTAFMGLAGLATRQKSRESQPELKVSRPVASTGTRKRGCTIVSYLVSQDKLTIVGYKNLQKQQIHELIKFCTLEGQKSSRSAAFVGLAQYGTLTAGEKDKLNRQMIDALLIKLRCARQGKSV